MLRISKLADYACLIMGTFAPSSEDPPSATEIAASLKLGLPTVRKILQLLSRAELLHASRGVTGGYQLAGPIEEISLLDIVEAVDGKLALTDCCTSLDCEIIEACQGQTKWRKINDVVAQALREKKLVDFT
jgi:FeS assembly SUF system regulator